MVDNIIDMQQDFEIKALRDEIQKLENQISKLIVLNKELGGDGDISTISDEELICIKQIMLLKERSETCELSTDELKNFDILNKNLRLIRGQSKRGRKSVLDDISTEDLKKHLK